MSVCVDGRSLTAEAVAAVAHGAVAHLDADARQRMELGHGAWLAHGGPVLEAKEALLTGFLWPGASGAERVRAFVESHCAGVGEPMPQEWVRATLLCRGNVLAAGLSGCRPQLVDLLLEMLRAGVHPVVPSQGSVGAAGDLSPLAAIARVAFRLGGKAWRDGRLLGAAEAMAGLPELAPEPKEVLALINGVSLSAGLAALAVVRARRLLLASEVALAMTLEAVLAEPGFLDAWALEARRHPGAVAVAERVRGLLAGSRLVHRGRQPDAFSIRCAPTVLGAAWDALVHVEGVVERELNGASDNPLNLGDRVVETGNFHGAPVALAMDLLKVAVTQVATASERRTFRLTYGRLTGNLPSFLVPGSGLHSGFMLAQYTAASLASECKGLAHPASVDTIPTVQHHEDHVSMAPIAARGALAILEAVADVVAIEALVAAQALEFRRRGQAWDDDGTPLASTPTVLAPKVDEALARVRQVSPEWTDDRVLHHDLVAVGGLVRSGALGAAPSPW